MSDWIKYQPSIVDELNVEPFWATSETGVNVYKGMDVVLCIPRNNKGQYLIVDSFAILNEMEDFELATLSELKISLIQKIELAEPVTKTERKAPSLMAGMDSAIHFIASIIFRISTIPTLSTLAH